MGCFVSQAASPRQLSPHHVPEPIDNILDETRYPSLQNAINTKEYYHYFFIQLGDQVYKHNDEGKRQRNNDQTVKGTDNYKQYLKVLNNSQHRNSKEIKSTLERLYRNYKLKQIMKRNQKKLTERERAYINKIDINQNVIKLFLFFFTADEIFPKYLKNTLRKGQYEQVCSIVDLLREHIAEKTDQDEKETILKRSEYTLYRGFGGINSPTMLEVSNLGVRGRKFFASFYLLEHERKNVLGSNCCLQIKLDPNNPYESMIIKSPFCKPGETKFIIFPFFYFEVETILMTLTSNQIRVRQVSPSEVQAT